MHERRFRLSGRGPAAILAPIAGRRTTSREALMLRAFEAVLAAMLFFFALLQHNDPDALYWFSVYASATLLVGLEAWRPGILAGVRWLRVLSLVMIAAYFAGFLSLAPAISADWIHVEEAREAFGYLICSACTLLAVLGGWRREAAAVTLGGRA
jgi:hypothetical protein